MEMHQIRYFLAVSETLNFTRAAERCNVSQPSLTAAIKKLEEELGGALIRRERHRSHLTDLGRLMRPHFDRILSASQAARAEAMDFFDLEKAPLKLGAMCTIGPDRMIDLFTRLRAEVPGVAVELEEAAGSVLIGKLLAGDLDTAIVGLPDYPERLDARPLYSETYVVAFPQGHRFESMTTVALAELEQEDYLSRVNCEHPQFLERLNISGSYDSNAKFRSEREDWVQAMIAAGMGVAIMPEFMPLKPGIGTRLLVEPQLNRTISLVTVSGRRFSPAIEIFVRLARHSQSEGA